VLPSEYFEFCEIRPDFSTTRDHLATRVQNKYSTLDLLFLFIFAFLTQGYTISVYLCLGIGVDTELPSKYNQDLVEMFQSILVENCDRVIEFCGLSDMFFSCPDAEAVFVED
jgi:hypothetical protein